MKLIIIILTIFLFNVNVKSQDKVLIKPINSANSLIIKEKHNASTYYRIPQGNSNSVKIKGPGVIKVYIKVNTKQDIKNDSIYLKYIIDNNLIRTRKIKNMEIDSFAISEENPILKFSKTNFVNIKIAPEDHLIKFLNTNNTEFFVKYVFIKEIKPSWQELSPSNNVGFELLKVSDTKTLKYYKLTTEKPIIIKTDGPTTLRVLVRSEFQCSMYGKCDFLLQVKKNGKLLNTYKISSGRSKTAKYDKNEDLIPGNLKKIYIKVPTGKNEYEFIVKSPEKSAILRFSIDKNKLSK